MLTNLLNPASPRFFVQPSWLRQDLRWARLYSRFIELGPLMKLIVTDREIIARRIRKMVSADYHVAVVSVPAELVSAVAVGPGVHLRYASALATPVVAALRYAVEDAGSVLIAVSPGTAGALIAHTIAHALSAREVFWTVLSEISPRGMVRALAKAEPLRRADVEAAATRSEVAAIFRFFTGRLRSAQSGVNATAIAVLRALFRHEGLMRSSQGVLGTRLTVTLDGWSAQMDRPIDATLGDDGLATDEMIDRAEWSPHLKIVAVNATDLDLAAPAPLSGFGLCEMAARLDGLTAGEIRTGLLALYLAGWITWPFGGVALLSGDARARALAFALRQALPATSARAITVARSRLDSAVVPVDFARDDSRLSAEHRTLYRRIWASALASALEPARAQQWTVKLQGVLQEDLHFTASGRTVVAPGWTSAYALVDMAIEDIAPAPPVRVGQFLRHQGCHTESVSSIPAPLSLGTLVNTVRAQTNDALETILDAVRLIEAREWSRSADGQIRLNHSGVEFTAALMERMRLFVEAATDGSIDTDARAVAASHTDRGRVIAGLYDRLGLVFESANLSLGQNETEHPSRRNITDHPASHFASH